MPNHCECDLSITGKISVIDSLLERYQGDDPKKNILLEAKKIIPYPEKFLELDRLWNKAHERYAKGRISEKAFSKIKDGFNSGGYEWCCANWGTKWGMYHFDALIRKTRSVLLSFRSAWSPPIPLIKRMSEDFPDLTFTMKYYESGVGFKGIYKVKAGVVLIDEKTTYSGPRGG